MNINIFFVKLKKKAKKHNPLELLKISGRNKKKATVKLPAASRCCIKNQNITFQVVSILKGYIFILNAFSADFGLSK